MQFGKRGSTAEDEQHNVDNSAKTLLANIRFMSVDKPVRTIVITSAIPSEGKTFVVAQLGRAMATSGKRTLLVECDMRRRSLASTLGIHAAYGLYGVMTGEVTLEDAAVPTGIQRLHFLDCEPHIPNPSDLLNARSFNRLMEMMKKSFDYVVFDTPPVGTFVDAAVLGAKVDAVFMVVRERYTRRDEVQKAADQLRKAKVPLSGIIMNYCERQSSEYYYEYYYKEGRRTRRRKSGYYGESMASYETAYDDVAAAAPTDPDPFAFVQPAPVSASDWSNAPDLDLLAETGTFPTQSDVAQQRIATSADSAKTTVAPARSAAGKRGPRFTTPSVEDASSSTSIAAQQRANAQSTSSWHATR